MLCLLRLLATLLMKVFLKALAWEDQPWQDRDKSGTRFANLLVPRGVFGPIYTYFEPNYLNFISTSTAP
jgi:hypothetical protein